MGFSIEQIRGVIPAMVTCFDENERVDEWRARAATRFLLDRGVNGLYLTGSTGEAFTMTPEERMRVAEIVIDEVKGRVPVIVHVGAIGTRVSEELARHAARSGADAVSSVPPFYWNFSPDAVEKYYGDVAAAAGIPMIVYNIALAGALSFSMIRRLAKVDGVAGMKFTAPVHHEILRVRQEIGPDFAVYSGMDEMAFSGLAHGANGIIGSFYNVLPDLYLELTRAQKAGDVRRAMACQDIANRVIYLALEYDAIPLIKHMMCWMGMDAGYSRRPFRQYSKDELAAIRARFAQLCREGETVEFLQKV